MSEVGQILEDRYCLEEELGCGAMGMVFRARHLRIGRAVAIKVLHGHLVRDATMVARFDREAAAIARLRHKNLVSVIDVGETAYERFMVMELARGPSLASVLSCARLERPRIVELVRQLLDGLAHAHDAGLVHRDLKPENVIVERDDFGREVPRIVDFGIAVLRDGSVQARLTAAGTILGTPAYMAPEQAQGAPPDPRTDLFALGVMLYEMLAGRQPFTGSSMEIVLANMSRDPPAIGPIDASVDPLLEAFARTLMARRASARFASARAAAEMLALIERDRDAAAIALGLRTRTTTAERPLARTLAMLRQRAAEERATRAEPVTPPPRQWPLVAGLLLVIGALIGWHLARPHAPIRAMTVDAST